MANHVYTLTEIVGSSTVGMDDAIRNGVSRAAQTIRNLNWFEVVSVRGHIDAEQVQHFQVQLKVGFRMDD